MAKPLSGSDSFAATLPTTVTSKPSMIHTEPSPITIIQCHRAQGSRSRRAGIRVRTVAMGRVFPLAETANPGTRPGGRSHW